MADSSLDDFFAKKDKSKKKNKAKYTATDILAKQGEEPKKPVIEKKKKEKEREKSDQPTNTSVKKEKVKEEDEWVDFEDEKDTDYSGLRVQNLQISQKEEENQQDKENILNDEEEDGENSEGREAAPSGPWKGGAAPQPVPTQPSPVEPEPVKVEEPVSKPTGKYVPPGARHAAATPRSSMQARGRKKTAPNIQSEEDFPTLGVAAPNMPDYDRSKFETVRSGGRQVDTGTNRNVPVSLGNRYSSLQD